MLSTFLCKSSSCLINVNLHENEFSNLNHLDLVSRLYRISTLYTFIMLIYTHISFRLLNSMTSFSNSEQ